MIGALEDKKDHIFGLHAPLSCLIRIVGDKTGILRQFLVLKLVDRGRQNHFFRSISSGHGRVRMKTTGNVFLANFFVKRCLFIKILQ